MTRKSPIGLITAVPFEASVILKEMKRKRKKGPFTSGYIDAQPVVHVSCGIGTANAAHGTTVLLKEHAPAMVILSGIGGAYPGTSLKMGDLAVAEREVYADLGVETKEGLLPIAVTGIALLRKGKKKYHNEFSLDRGLLRQAVVHIRGVKKGVFLTVSQVTGTRGRALELRGRYRALCENMEGAAVAQICTLYGIPLLELRGISNMVEDRDAAGWNKSLAAKKSQEAVIEFIAGRF